MTIQAVELLPCPFCGAAAELIDGRVECCDCGAELDQRDAIQKWNTRAALSHLGVQRPERNAIARIIAGIVVPEHWPQWQEALAKADTILALGPLGVQRPEDVALEALEPFAKLGGRLDANDKVAGLEYRAAFWDCPSDLVLYNDRMGAAITVGDVRRARVVLALPHTGQPQEGMREELKALSKEIESEAENLSPKRGHCKGQVHPAPELRKWAKRLRALSAALVSPRAEGEWQPIVTRVAAIELWRDHYADGPDILNDKKLAGHFTPDDVRKARLLLAEKETR